MAVSTTNLYSSTRDVLKSVINANVTDPNTGKTNSSRRWIYRFIPDTTKRNFSGYPYIVISPTDPSDTIVTLNGIVKDNTFVFEIEVYNQFDDVNARMDDLVDQIIAAINSQSAQDTYATNGLYSPKILSIAADTTIIDNRQVTTALIRVEFNSLLCYS